MPAITDPGQIRRLLETDRAWAVYALGDLSPQLFPQCSWFANPDSAQALVLLCHAFGTPVLFTLGDPLALGWMLDEIGDHRELYLHVRPEIVSLVRIGYRVEREKKMCRMILRPEKYHSRVSEAATRLHVSDTAALRRLYGDGETAGEAPDFFEPSMVKDGVFYGIWEDNELVAAAGTHLVVPAEGVAAIGNIYTRRDRRGRGLATRVTDAVTAELMRLKLPTIALNVGHGNAAAIRVYERLGFEPYCDFHEGIAHRTSDSVPL